MKFAKFTERVNPVMAHIQAKIPISEKELLYRLYIPKGIITNSGSRLKKENIDLKSTNFTTSLFTTGRAKRGLMFRTGSDCRKNLTVSSAKSHNSTYLFTTTIGSSPGKYLSISGYNPIPPSRKMVMK